MRPVLLKKRKYTYKDIFRIIGILSLHYISFYTFLAIIFGLHYASRGSFVPDFEFLRAVTIFGVIFTPAFNAVFHITYAEKGWAWFRFIMWLNTIFFVVIITMSTYL